ncbi:PREDICTED: pentatricopeptide repeat-containing protein At2g35130-like [Populus euphratica]|uniref:Pentatricopeptide repeat-containing protein At2g35130-like n=1 Tax=Populus euphratica TaxID=75702 RepID=A0AAJ6TNF1_POPEU|nr:PREDICTED: pentatricopeptide repeat-containing protein At2g35130-like [Populus euphratica]
MGDSQYSFSLTTFSPTGKLVQIEHALTAVGSGQTSLGMLLVRCTLNHIFIESRIRNGHFRRREKNSRSGDVKMWKSDRVYIDKHGKWRIFDQKKMSRKRCGSLRGQGWKYGSGFVDGFFPVLSPVAHQILNFVWKEVDPNNVWAVLDTLPVTHETWDDLVNVAFQLRLNKQWDPIALICQWILYNSSFQTDVMCSNLLIDAYGHKSLYKKAEETYVDLLQARCIPTEDTYALLIKAYCACGLLEKAEAAFVDMRKYSLPPSAIVYNACIDGLMKAGTPQRAIEIFQRMKSDGCQPSTDTYTLLINLHGKVSSVVFGSELFCKSDLLEIPMGELAFTRVRCVWDSWPS